MNVVVTEDPQRLTVTQRYTMGYKLKRIFPLLLFCALLPAPVLYFSGTGATLTCAREVGAGVVCTDWLDWLGSFRRGWRYEHVEQAYVPAKLTPGRAASDNLHLKTAAGIVNFSSVHHNGYIDFDRRINAFIENESAGELVASDPANVPAVAISAAILLAVFYFCLSMPLKIGMIAIFDLPQAEVRLHSEGFWGATRRTFALNAISRVHGGGSALYGVYLTVAAKDVLICWFGEGASPAPADEARDLVAQINRWLPHLRTASPAGPPPPDLIEVSDPDLAYLLGYSESNAAVTYANIMHLRMDRMVATVEQKRNIRAALGPRPPRSAWPPDVLARELVAICQVDVREAFDAAGPQQRAALVRLLGSLPRP